MIKTKATRKLLPTQLEITILLILLALLAPLISASSHDIEPIDTGGFDPNNPESWDFSDPLLYDHPEVFENPALYGQIQWGLVPESSYAHVVDWGAIHDFSAITLSSQHIAWNNVHQEYITGRKVSEIPDEHFNPAQVKKENLKFATADQIGLHLAEFDNLRDADPSEVSTVFAREPFHAELDISRANTVRFDQATNMITGDFPAYDPADYPKGNYKQQIIGQQVIITPLKEDGTPDTSKEVIIFGKKATFFRNTDDSINVDITDMAGDEEAGVTGKQKGHITTTDDSELDFDTREGGEVVIKENGDVYGRNTRVINDEQQEVIEGTFSIKENGLRIELQSDNGQSTFFDGETQTMVTTNGNGADNPLVVVQEDYGIPADADNYVVYGEDVLHVHGLAEADQYDLHAITEHPTATVDYEHESITAQGLVRVTDDHSFYQGYSTSSTLERHREGITDMVRIDGSSDGTIGLYVQKALLTGSDPETSGGVGQRKENSLVIVVDRVNGAMRIDAGQDSLGILAETAQTPGNLLLFENQLHVQAGQNSMDITKEGGLFFTDSKGKITEILSPQNTQFVVGDTLLDVNEQIAELDKQIQERTANGEDASYFINQRSLLQFLNVNYQAQGLLDTQEYDTAIGQLTAFMDEHRDSAAFDYAKMSLAELYLSKSLAEAASDQESQQARAQALVLYRELLAKPGLSDDARRGIAVTLHQQKLYDQARDAYLSVIDSSPNKATAAATYIAIAGTYLEADDNPRFAIAALDQALKADPDNQEAIELKMHIESALLDTISQAISGEDAILMKQWEEKIGLGQEVWNTGIGTSMMALFTDYYENVETSAVLVKEQLSVQQRGVLLIKSLHDKGTHSRKSKLWVGKTSLASSAFLFVMLMSEGEQQPCTLPQK
ncbi:hypothetical protein HYS47_00710 [Candidatus Woesearchaeota archaeon]|nr:hypothetical protein [Candidatus Woesearchaeota archaeon]